MSRIPRVDLVDEPPELKPVFDQLRETRGRVPSMYRILAHRPEILAAHRAYFHAALDTGTLGRKFKEMVAFKVASVCGSAYSSASHRRYALHHGVSEDEIAAIERSEFARFDGRTRVALEFAVEIAEGGAGPTPQTFDALRQEFATEEIVELSALVCIMQLASSLGAIFDLEADGED